MRCLLPPSLDLADHLTRHPPDTAAFGPAGFCRDALAYVLHLVTAVPAENRKLAATLDGPLGYVPLQAARLQLIIRQYNFYLSYAVTTGLLETDNHFIRPSAGAWGRHLGKCRGFRCAAPFRGGWATAGGARVVELREPGLLRRLARAQRRYGGLTVAVQDEYRALLGWLDPATTPLRIREAEALRHIAALYEERQQNPARRQRRFRIEPGQSAFKDPEAQYQQQFTTIHQLACRAIQRTVDAQGRLHTTLTNASKVLRPYLYLEGYEGPLVAIDLTNSQPLLASLLLQPAFHGAMLPCNSLPGTPLKIPPNLADKIRRLTKRDAAFYITLVNRLQEANNGGKSDIVTYLRWTKQGQFYERVQQALNAGQQALGLSRDDVKALTFEVFFSSNFSDSPAKAGFARLFPTVDAVLRAHKHPRHEPLAQLLQLLEAHIFLHVIAGRIRREQPLVPLFSIHDSLVTTESHADYVERVMRQELTRWVGVTPQFKRSVWGRDPALEGSAPSDAVCPEKQ